MDMPLFLYGMVLIRVGGVELKQRQSFAGDGKSSSPHSSSHQSMVSCQALQERESKFNSRSSVGFTHAS